MVLIQYLMVIIDYSMVNFNEFFQFVIYFSLAPMVSIFYFILHAIHNVIDQITWEDILKLTSSLDTINKVDESAVNLFKKYDMNKDGFLSFNQFCNFTSQTQVLWDPLFKFRESLVNHVFPDLRYRIILLRRERINDINEYLKNHNGKYPPPIPPTTQHLNNFSCFSRLINNIIGIPPNWKYDYSVESIETLSMAELTNFMIKKYNKEYVNNKEFFAMKYLNIYNQYPIILDIDQFYVKFKAALPKKTVSPFKLSIAVDINSQDNSRKNSVHSILRDSRRNTSFHKISITSSRKCSTQAHMYGQQPVNRTSLLTLTKLHKYSLQNTPKSKKSLPPLKISHRSANGNLRVSLHSTPFSMSNVVPIPETPLS